MGPRYSVVGRTYLAWVSADGLRHPYLDLNKHHARENYMLQSIPAQVTYYGSTFGDIVSTLFEGPRDPIEWLMGCFAGGRGCRSGIGFLGRYVSM